MGYTHDYRIGMVKYESAHFTLAATNGSEVSHIRLTDFEFRKLLKGIGIDMSNAYDLKEEQLAFAVSSKLLDKKITVSRQ